MFLQSESGSVLTIDTVDDGRLALAFSTPNGSMFSRFLYRNVSDDLFDMGVFLDMLQVFSTNSSAHVGAYFRQLGLRIEMLECNAGGAAILVAIEPTTGDSLEELQFTGVLEVGWQRLHEAAASLSTQSQLVRKAS